MSEPSFAEKKLHQEKPFAFHLDAFELGYLYALCSDQPKERRLDSLVERLGDFIDEEIYHKSRWAGKKS